MMTATYAIRSDDDAIEAVKKMLRDEGLSSKLTILGADAGEAPAVVRFSVSPYCRVSGYSGRYTAKINRKTGDVFSVDGGGGWQSDEHEED
jgi:hypothetical protein